MQPMCKPAQQFDGKPQQISAESNIPWTIRFLRAHPAKLWTLKTQLKSDLFIKNPIFF
jgi:hypothetical protein